MFLLANSHLEKAKIFSGHRGKLDLTSDEIFSLSKTQEAQETFIRCVLSPTLKGAVGGLFMISAKRTVMNRTGEIDQQILKGMIVGGFLGGFWGSFDFFLKKRILTEKKQQLEKESEKTKQLIQLFFKKVLEKLADRDELLCPITGELFFLPIQVKCGSSVAHIFEYKEIRKWIEQQKGQATCPTCRGNISLEGVELAIEKRQEISHAITKELVEIDDRLRAEIQKILEARNRWIDILCEKKGDLMSEWGKSLKIKILSDDT